MQSSGLAAPVGGLGVVPGDHDATCQTRCASPTANEVFCFAHGSVGFSLCLQKFDVV